MNWLQKKCEVIRNNALNGSIPNWLKPNLVCLYDRRQLNGWNNAVDAKWYDSSGNGRHGTLSNISFTTGSTLDGNGAMLDGTNDYIQLGGANIGITNNLTVFMWVNGAAQNTKQLISKFDSLADKRSWRICTNFAGSKMRVTVYADGTAVGNTKDYESSVTVFDSRNHFIAFTIADNMLNLFVDGALDVNPKKTTDNTVNAIYSSAIPVLLGAYYVNGSLTGNFAGTEGLVGICNKALSAYEIRFLFESQRKGYGI